MIRLAIARPPDDRPELRGLLASVLSVQTTSPSFEVIDEKSPVDATTVGLVVGFRNDPYRGFLSMCGELWARGVRRFLVVIELGHGSPPPWASLLPMERAAFDHVAIVSRFDNVTDLLKDLDAIAARPIERWACDRLNHAISAGSLYYEVLRDFGHNARADVSNQFLAPARLLLADPADPDLLQQCEPGWRVIWEKFSGAIQAAQAPRFLPLGTELLSATAPINAWLLEGGPRCSASDLSRVMALLTACRASSGLPAAKGHGPTGTEQAPSLVSTAGGDFRVLVVDDHAAAWQPVFRRIQAQLLAAKEMDVGFDFSIDGNETRVNEYDVVILDIFLGALDGREVLDQVRSRMALVPVLLWTTSRDDEITTRASQANGILLKKTVTIEAIVDALALWCPVGRAMRHSSLPNPTFNSLIKTPECRELIQNANEWCLKQLDSFHALDGSYFRYFTDHGGRHIVKLLELLEQALGPFLGDRTDITLLPADAKAREFEVLALCVTVVCHELGMFPLKVGATIEDFSTLGDDYLDDVRSLHAIRGMVLIQDSKGAHWTDATGRKLGAELHRLEHPGAPGVALADVVAALVGYHARCLKSMAAGSFLQWTGDERFRKLRSSTATLGRSDQVFREALQSLHDTFSTPERAELLERLRRQCALFRFVDAVDLSASRNPALFLIQHSRRTALNNREYLKRQLCADASFTDGCFEAHMRAGWPDRQALEDIVESVRTFSLLGPDTASSVAAARQFLASTGLDWARPEPWKLEFKSGADSVGANREQLARSILSLQRPLDAWLKATWEVLMASRVFDAQFVGHLQKLNVLDKGTLPRISRAGRELIASVTALSVAGEVLDEYEAIVYADLTDQIALGKFKLMGWHEEGPHDDREEVTILGEGLRQYAAGTSA